jgi:hypothetical protein
MLQRQAFIGFAASVVSDTVSNSLRVVKTYRQVHEKNVGYREPRFELHSSGISAYPDSDRGEGDCSRRGHLGLVWSRAADSAVDQRFARALV